MAAALAAAALRGDIRANTTIRCYVKDVPTPCTGPLREGGVVAGSNAEGTFFEAMFDAAQTLNAIKNAVQAVIAQNFPAAAQELKKAYDEAVELQQSGADKTSVQKAYVRLDQAAPYTRVTLTFDALSDDDPFRDLRVAAPRVRYTLPGSGTGDDGGPVPTMGSTLDAVVIEQIQGGRGSRSGRAMVTLYPKRMPQGAFYPVLFSTKETDCSICLGILHDIEVSTYKTCAQVLIPGTYCETKGREFYANVDEINRNYDAAYREPAVMRGDRARQRYCGPDALGNPRFPPPTGCASQAEERPYPGACAQWIAGLSAQSCARIEPYFRRIRELEAANEVLANTLRLNECCNEFVNPSGGNGIKPKEEMYQTAPGNRGHSAPAHGPGNETRATDSHAPAHGHVAAPTPAPHKPSPDSQTTSGGPS